MAYRKNKDGSFSYYYKEAPRKQRIIQPDWFKEHGYKTDQFPEEFWTYVDEQLTPPRCGYWAIATDGDGTISWARNHCVEIALTSREPIQYLADLYGVSLSYVSFPTEPNWKNMYRVSLTGKRAHHFAKKICPYMIEKKHIALKLINRKEPNYHPPKIPMDFRKDPGSISTHMHMVAGLFDTEGSVGIKPSYSKYQSKKKGLRIYSSLNQWIQFTNTNLRPLRKIKKILESWPFIFKLTIRKDMSRLFKKNGDLQKQRYKLTVPTGQHRLFMKLFSPLLMIKKKKQESRFDDLAEIDKRFFPDKYYKDYPNQKPDGSKR